MPLSIFEHPLWIEAFHVLKPDYKPPSRKILSTTLLEEEYKEMKTVVSKKIDQAKVLHLAVDGWTNVRKDSIINIMIYTPTPFFHTSIDTETNRHTGEYLAEKISETMDEIGSEKFLGIISDNAANMKKCGKLLADKYETTTWIGCLAHTLNLLIADLLKMPEVHEVFKMVVDIVKCVLKSNIFCAEFKKIATDKLLNVTLVLPVKTRWGSYSHCLENFLKSKEILQTMVINENNREMQKFKSELLEGNTWSIIEKQINLFKPIVKWIFKLEGDACTIHLVQRALEEVESILISDAAKQIFSDEHYSSVLQKFKERKQNCLKPVHLAAVILDPKNQGTSLNSEEHLDGCSAILDIAECDAQTILIELSDYKCRNGLFEKEFVWQTAQSIEPIAWWQSLYPNCLLGKVALKILTVPATSASVERSFSTFSNIHTKKRNRLQTERCMKICYISHNWKLLHQKESQRRTADTYMNQSNVSENNSENDLSNSSFELEAIDFISEVDEFDE
jgi:hypothetical protein